MISKERIFSQAKIMNRGVLEKVIAVAIVNNVRS